MLLPGTCGHDLCARLLPAALVSRSDPCSEVGPSGWGKDEDALNLAGLLNVLDGVVDSPGRILVRSGGSFACSL